MFTLLSLKGDSELFNIGRSQNFSMNSAMECPFCIVHQLLWFHGNNLYYPLLVVADALVSAVQAQTVKSWI